MKTKAKDVEFEVIERCPLLKHAQQFYDAGLYEKSFVSSTFKKNYLDPHGISISAVVAKVGGRPVGVAILHHGGRQDTVNYLRKPYSYGLVGWVGLYVDPAYRKQGICRDMCNLLKPLIEKSFTSSDLNFKFIGASDVAARIVEKFFNMTIVTQSRNNVYVWKDKAKSLLRMGFKGTSLYYN